MLKILKKLIDKFEQLVGGAPVERIRTLTFLFSVSVQILIIGLNYKTIILTLSQIITSQITTGPLFNLGRINFDLRFTGISLTDNTGKGVNQLLRERINNQQWDISRNKPFNNLLFFDNCNKLLETTGATQTITRWSGTVTQLDALIKISGIEIIVGTATVSPTFSSPKVFNVTGDKLDYVNGSFNSYGTNRTQTKTILTDEVTIGEGMILRTISVLMQDSRFINNQGSDSEAITFVNKGVKIITFSNDEFTGNLNPRNDINKANAIFANYLNEKFVLMQVCQKEI
ncbi:MAG: hypothetical protein EZS28_005618 [Streblomastix strix]|uniref:Uncharacterized protein n=1 Tax=Streblomastix strix TaxID=222440 RepID=A0A5J4WUY0_9EUKA|nr:MAG: hypothetical protein EZS28_005618 [Streblomastix strix]